MVQRTGGIAADLHGEVVMISLERGNYYGLGEMGSLIWRRIVRPTRIDVLCEQLQAEFEVDRETCEAELIEFLGNLYAEGLVTVVEDATTA